MHYFNIDNGGIEKADFCVVQWLNGPATPVLVSDIKQKDLDAARKEMAGYAVRAMEVRSPSEDNNLTICLGLPIGDGKCKLLVYVGNNDLVHEIVVIDTLQPSLTFFSIYETNEKSQTQAACLHKT